MKSKENNVFRDDVRFLLARLLGLLLQRNQMFLGFENRFLMQRRLELCTLIIPLKR